MPMIHLLDEPTINQIAAGEVVERPSAVVKELIENAMDAGATAITAEIKEGGLSFIRITDNGAGIVKEDIPLAFLRHATSKIRTAQDLLSVTSLGFRGEALSSIAAVAQVELISKTPSALNGFRYLMEGGEEKLLEEIGCPGGTTIIVRNLFYNTPARRKFLKSATTEAGYISDLMERLMVSHPGVSFKFIVNQQIKLQSSGNHSSRDILYQVYGREIVKELLPVEYHSEDIKIKGFIGKPVINRGNRNYENYFINGRYIKSNVITRAIEEAYKPYLMQHKYPFTSLYLELNPAAIDVNVHPQKLEIRLKNGEEVFRSTMDIIRNTLSSKEMIPKVLLSGNETEKINVTANAEKKKEAGIPEPFEQNRRKQFMEQPLTVQLQNSFQSLQPQTERINEEEPKRPIMPFVINYEKDGSRSIDYRVAEAEEPFVQDKLVEKAVVKNNFAENQEIGEDILPENNAANISQGYFTADRLSEAQYSQVKRSEDKLTEDKSTEDKFIENQRVITGDPLPEIIVEEQMNLFSFSETSEEKRFLSKSALDEHRIIGQIFSTYWLVEYKKELYIIDQHAAHEKVLYEKIMAAAKTKTISSQQLLPPIVLSLTLREQELLHRQKEVLESLGYEIEYFGGNEFSVRAVPADLFGISEKELLLEFIDELAEDTVVSTMNANSILERVASLSCKAAVKANHVLSGEEASVLIKELLTLDNPYHCPHGRPVIVSMSQYELERKFKRVL